MKIYFRARIEYDIRRSGVDSVSYEYSLTEYDRTKQPLDGFYEFADFDIPDDYTEEEATALCKKMISNCSRYGDTLNTTLTQELKNRKK